MVKTDAWFDAQVGVLGSVLIEPTLAPQMIVETQAEDFNGDFRGVWSAIAGLLRDGEPVDAMTVRNRLGAASNPLLAELVRATPTTANFAAYVAACREQSRLRRLQGLSLALNGSVTLDDAREVLGRMQSVAVEHNRQRVSGMMDALTDFYQAHHEGRGSCIPWGIPALDDQIRTDRGDVVVIGGYPSDGKSALMIQCALHMAKTCKVGIFSFETSRRKLMSRIVAHRMGIDMRRIVLDRMEDADWQQISRYSRSITDLKLEIIEASGMTTNDIMAMSLSRSYEVIYLDYIQLISSVQQRRGGTRQEELAEISKALHILAQRHGILVVELSQLSRPPKTKDGKFPPPTLASLRESGQLEQDADVVMLLYRMYPGQTDSPRELYVAKYKEGPLGKLALRFDGGKQRFFRTAYEEVLRVCKARDPVDGQSSLDGLDEPDADCPFQGEVKQ
ncbi:MAG: hypothetical protein IKM84_04465 [Oscillospiraceae bacterium]|nr:hypothetical protein [Oscillospiraceae bacterium]